jgi:hypothetical protein
MTQSIKTIWNLYVKSYYLAVIITIVSILIGVFTGNQTAVGVFNLSSAYLKLPLTLFTAIPFGFIELAIIGYGIIGIMALGEIISKEF